MPMNTPLTFSRALLATLALSAIQIVSAQDKGCVELKTTAEVEQEYVSEQGQKAKRLLPAGKVTPGDEVVWTITAKNVCDKPAENIVIANPVPEHMSYVANSAMGVGTVITYSLDSKEFKDAAALTVRAEDGSTRAARADEYRAIRWTYAAPFAPGATAFVRYRAVVK
jgi:uncharacterized repeat protein (TIGR01451 family)